MAHWWSVSEMDWSTINCCWCFWCDWDDFCNNCNMNKMWNLEDVILIIKVSVWNRSATDVICSMIIFYLSYRRWDCWMEQLINEFFSKLTLAKCLSWQILYEMSFCYLRMRFDWEEKKNWFMMSTRSNKKFKLRGLTLNRGWSISNLDWISIDCLWCFWCSWDNCYNIKNMIKMQNWNKFTLIPMHWRCIFQVYERWHTNNGLSFRILFNVQILCQYFISIIKS